MTVCILCNPEFQGTNIMFSTEVYAIKVFHAPDRYGVIPFKHYTNWLDTSDLAKEQTFILIDQLTKQLKEDNPDIAGFSFEAHTIGTEHAYMLVKPIWSEKQDYIYGDIGTGLDGNNHKSFLDAMKISDNEYGDAYRDLAK